MAEDPILELDEEEFGVRLTRGRVVYDFEAAQELKNADPASTRILVTTLEKTPDGKTYPIAEAIFDEWRSNFPLTQLRFIGRGDVTDFVEMIREDFDYLFVIGKNQGSREYDSEQTLYSSRSTGVRCRPSLFVGGVDCSESSTSRSPIGSRTVKRTIYSDTFYVTYGSAAQAAIAYSLDNDNQTRTRELSNGNSIGNTHIRLGHGTSDATWCDNTVGAQTHLARMLALNLVATKPDEFNTTVAPDEIGCGD
ncbi:hypothetical protein E5843_02900 [Luteimonas yindakuii]|uniref:hypothetical protein n=1 Tax=Luteimonas yindakuii TaxID=2565782 RepID=UPI0010A3D153|nr:hypothetical protein [Luteimonas yindakuii]QCO66987.1 hypothetical protein E5843_02900 [Luteimonas yindakuii]